MPQSHALLLDCQIQEYAWGSRESIAALLGRQTPSEQPQAELWMGAHPKAPARVHTSNGTQRLDQLIQATPVQMLGKRVAERYGKLPYLLKILAAAGPLSIQAHPNKTEAERGFARENEAGIPLSARHRNYKDDNHKPELICAITPFWALKGFRTPSEILGLVETMGLHHLAPLMAPLAEHPDEESQLKAFFTALMSLDPSTQAAYVNETVSQLTTTPAEAHIADWIKKLNGSYPGDIGALAPLYLHLIQLQPGEALYLGPGELHAYLDGTGIELMANSDNVLRGGLTPKHIDVPELLSVLTFASVPLAPMRAQAGAHPYECHFDTPAPEFHLSVMTLEPETTQRANNDSPEILLCLTGQATLRPHGDEAEAALALDQGTVCFLPASHPPYTLEANAKTVIYKASVPL